MYICAQPQIDVSSDMNSHDIPPSRMTVCLPMCSLLPNKLLTEYDLCFFSSGSQPAYFHLKFYDPDVDTLCMSHFQQFFYPYLVSLLAKNTVQ